jgi:hypothetical protein
MLLQEPKLEQARRVIRYAVHVAISCQSTLLVIHVSDSHAARMFDKATCSEWETLDNDNAKAETMLLKQA